MNATLDQERVRVVAQLRHAELSARDDVHHHADPLEVGRIAAKLAQRYFLGDLGAASTSQVNLARCAGMLVYAMERWGYNFEELCDVADYSVASVVSGLSPDVRMPPGLRSGHHCSTLSQADAAAQIVKLAEVIATCERVLNTFPHEMLALHAQTLKQWGDDSYQLVGAMTRLRDNKRMKQILDETRAKLQEVVSVAEEARRPRRAAAVTATAI